MAKPVGEFSEHFFANTTKEHTEVTKMPEKLPEDRICKRFY
jgi:hypothetical protein